MPHLQTLATCQSLAALKRSDRSKQCHWLQFAQSALLDCMTSWKQILQIITNEYDML